MDFQEKYKNIQREIRDLKTAHNARSNMRTFFGHVNIGEMWQFQPTTIRITYADGDQPILTTSLGEPSLIPTDPVGNVQDFIWAYGDDRYATWNASFFFLSTRKIENIDVIHP